MGPTDLWRRKFSGEVKAGLPLKRWGFVENVTTGGRGGLWTVTIYALMIYTAPCRMFWMRAYTLEGKWEGVGPWNSLVFWAL